MNRNSWLAAGASLLLAAFASPAQSAQVLYNAGDLVLAFRASGGQGEAQSLLVNLGAASQFTGAAGGTFDLSLGNLGGALSDQFGSTWYDRTDLTWSVFGSNTTTNPILYASRAQVPYGTDPGSWDVLPDVTDRNTVRGAIQSVTGAFDLLEATSFSTVAALQTNGSGAESYKQQVTGGSTDFSNVSLWTNIEGSFGPGSEALNLYRVTGTAGTTGNLGTFTISNSGTVTFSGVGAVPEPSKTVFAMLGVGSLFLRRRRPAPQAGSLA